MVLLNQVNQEISTQIVVHLEPGQLYREIKLRTLVEHFVTGRQWFLIPGQFPKLFLTLWWITLVSYDQVRFFSHVELVLFLW